jgi:hypothetical protein
LWIHLILLDFISHIIRSWPDHQWKLKNLHLFTVHIRTGALQHILDINEHSVTSAWKNPQKFETVQVWQHYTH